MCNSFLTPSVSKQASTSRKKSRGKKNDTGETFSLDVDMVIKAAGQMPFESLVEELKIQNSKGKINITDSATNIPGVFAGGDCVNGGKEVVDAVQAGKDGATSILSYLGIKK